MHSSKLASDPRVQVMSMICAPLYLFDPFEVSIVWANEHALAFWEASTDEELYCRNLKGNITRTASTRLAQIAQECFESNSPVVEHWTIYPKKTPKSSDFQITPFVTNSGQSLLLMHVLNASASRDTHIAYSSSALMHTSAMISGYDKCSRLVYCNAAARASIPESVETSHHRLVEAADFDNIQDTLIHSEFCEIEARVFTTLGVRWHALHIQRCIDPISAKTLYLVTETDITEQHAARQEAQRLAFTDSLTALPNRAALNLHLNKLLNGNAVQPFAVLFLDLDRFKVINDSLGHSAGDQLLIRVAKRLQQAVGGKGLVYRLGGDEFFIIINQFTELTQLTEIAEQILCYMAPPILVTGHKLRAIPSIGICTYPHSGSNPSTLMENADTAMYLAKAEQCGYHFYDARTCSSLSKNIKDRMYIETDMVAALENRQFELYFQPKIDCRTMSVSGVEALIRWHHPVRGLVPPDKFISVAEDTGQIIDIGRWVLETAMIQQRYWENVGLSVPVSINISPRQFRANDLLADITGALALTGCNPKMIELEITESMLIGEPDLVSETLHRLSSLGIRLALDDFGTGFANLDCLQKYPLDCMKIDKIFLCDRKRSMLMSTILNMGKVLGLEVVVEGVETTTQVDWLVANGCDLMQGFFFSKPLPANQITPYLLDNGAPRKAISKAA